MSMGRRRGSTQAKAICMVIWLAGFLLSLPALLFRSVQFFPDLEAEACYLAYPHDGWRLRFNMTVNVVGFLIPVPLVCYCSYHIIAVLGNKQMDEVKPVSAASFQLQNTTDSPSLSMTFNSSDWYLVYAIVPPYIFILCLTGILGNAFVLLVFFLQRSHWTIPEIYLGNLALADLILLAGLPFWAMNILNYFYWSYGEFLCKVVNLSIIVNMYTSIYMLVMVNVDRYLALVLTMKARWLRRRRNAKAVCFCLWVFGLAMGIPTATYRTVQNSPAFEHAACIIIYPLESLKVAHSLQLNLLGFALPLLAIVFCSCNIVRALHKRRQNVDIQDRNDRKATVLVCAVTLLFLLCWGPFHIITFLDTLCDLHVLDMMRWYHALDIGSQFSTYLAFLNSCLNPLLYVCTGHYFRRKVSEIYKRRRSSVGSVVTALQRSVVSTYVQRTDQIKPVVL
uniref:G-protein coupled receptors family 1 profile domain-containing protein n=1 Tax=Pygocentrus nattereri TaxID=42514 RepID=A0A3B4BPL4_PYGNA